MKRLILLMQGNLIMLYSTVLYANKEDNVINSSMNLMLGKVHTVTVATFFVEGGLSVIRERDVLTRIASK